MAQRGMILIISGPSGSGKGTLLARAMELRGGMRYSTSVTTRKPRPGEIPEVSYFFRTDQEFDQMVASGEILEWDKFAGNRYGTPRTPIAKALEEGTDIVMDITVKGAMAVKRAFGDDAVTVFILPPSMEELERRLRGRKTEDERAIQRRLAIAGRELRARKHFQYTLVNDDVDRAAGMLLAFLEEQEKIRTICEHF